MHIMGGPLNLGAQAREFQVVQMACDRALRMTRRGGFIVKEISSRISSRILKVHEVIERAQS